MGWRQQLQPQDAQNKRVTTLAAQGNSQTWLKGISGSAAQRIGRRLAAEDLSSVSGHPPLPPSLRTKARAGRCWGHTKQAGQREKEGPIRDRKQGARGQNAPLPPFPQVKAQAIGFYR